MARKFLKIVSIFLLFPTRKSPGIMLIVAGGNPWPPALGDSPAAYMRRPIVVDPMMFW